MMAGEKTIPKEGEMARFGKAIMLAILLAGLTGFAVRPAAAGGHRAATPRVKVTGQARLTLAPDQVTVNVGVASRADSAQKAAAANAAAMAKVRAAVKAALGKDGSLQTAEYRVYPRTEWDPKTRTSRTLGYEALNRLRVESPKVEAIGRVLAAATAAGANRIDGPRWGLAHPRAARRKVQVLAFKDARAQAKALAAEAGMALGPVISISATDRGRPGPVRMMAMNAKAEAAPPMEPGQIELSASVTCVFALAPGR